MTRHFPDLINMLLTHIFLLVLDVKSPLNVGYRINKDTSSLFSYSFDGTILSLDPVSTGGPGWDDFLVAYNQFCSDRNGVPLFNQTKSITPSQAKKAFGQRLETFKKSREQYDPDNRMLNEYFKSMME